MKRLFSIAAVAAALFLVAPASSQAACGRLDGHRVAAVVGVTKNVVVRTGQVAVGVVRKAARVATAPLRAVRNRVGRCNCSSASSKSCPV